MTFVSFLNALEKGEIRACQKVDGRWIVESDVKSIILKIFRESAVVPMGKGFCDKEPLAPQDFDLERCVRVVPGGSSVRRGAHVGKNVIIMPPSFINIGAFVDEETMIDSHVLVGSCAQIGKRVHLSAGVQIGGVLEPIGQRPVIVEDNSFIGAGAILTEGVLIEEGAVLGPGLVLSASVPIYDTINEKIFYGTIPGGAVVISGTRPLARSTWAKELGLSLAAAIIVKYRDDKTQGALMLENALRAEA